MHRVGVNGPAGPLPRLLRAARDLYEAVVEGEVVPEGVLPALRVLAVEWETLHDIGVDVGERQHLLLRALDGHVGEPNVGVGRFLKAMVLPRVEGKLAATVIDR